MFLIMSLKHVNHQSNVELGLLMRSFTFTDTAQINIGIKYQGISTQDTPAHKAYVYGWRGNEKGKAGI